MSRSRIVAFGAAALLVTVAALFLYASTPSRATPPGNETAAVEPAVAPSPATTRPRPQLSSLEELDRKLHQGPPKAVRLRWPDVPRSRSPRALVDASFDLIVENLSSELLTVDVSVTVDAGTGLASKSDLDTVVIPAETTSRLPINLEDLVPDLHSLEFSGRLHATAEATLSNARVVIESSPGVFFHREPDGIERVLVYNEQVLREQFASGDFRGLIQIPEEDGVVTERIVSALVSTRDPVTVTTVNPVDTDDDLLSHD